MNYESFNRGGPNSDQHQFSHNNKQIYTLSQEKVVRINKTITKINGINGTYCKLIIIIITFQKVELLTGGGGGGSFTVICATYFILLSYNNFNIW